MIAGDASQILALAARFAAAPPAAVLAAGRAVELGATALEVGWRANARATSGAHGKHYPNAITHEVHVIPGAVVADVGPETGRPQGGMGPGFEFGSVNQPPHLDGTKALDATSGVTEQAIATGVFKVLP